MGENKSFTTSLALALLLLVLAFLFYTLLQPKSVTASVRFLDVGQGDAALFETPYNQRILIDGGPSDAVVSALDKAIPFYERRLDGIVLTHPHADHLNGLLKVIKTYEVRKVYLTGVMHTTPEYIEFLDEIKNRQIAAENVVAGKELELEGGIKVSFLFPTKGMVGEKAENLNNTSIVSRITWDESSLLLTGDLEAEGQAEMVKTKQEFESDVLKVPHHGSKDSATKFLLDKVRPKFAVISVGKDNKFGHPSEQAINLLRSVKLFRTDYDGTVKCDFSPKEIGCATAIN